MKYAILLTLLILVGCTPLTTEEIEQKVIDANMALDSYGLDISMTINTDTVFMNQPVQITSSLVSQGQVDKTTEKLKMTGTLTTLSSGKSNDAPVNVYLIDDTMYSEIMGRWVKKKFDNDVWAQQDRLEQLMTLIQSGSITLNRTESIGDQEYYVIEIIPDIQELVRIMMKQQGQLDFFNESLDFEDIIRDYRALAWVNADTFIIERNIVDMTMVMTEENLNLDLEGEEVYLEMVTHTEIQVTNIGATFDIVLPEASETAVDLDEMEALQAGMV